MSKALTGTIYAIAMATVIIGIDVAFFRNHFWERLMANIGIATLFAAFYFRFFGLPWK